MNIQSKEMPKPHKEMSSPSEEELDSELFNSIWEVIKKWDINAPDYYSGYCGANGSHVKLILDAIKKPLRNEKINELLDES